MPTKPKGKAIDDRMKEYEAVSDYRLPKRMPLIIRVDGKAFHTLLRKAEKPFDPLVIHAMQQTAMELCRQVAGTRLAYTQSDEISLVVRDDNTLATEPWLDKRIQKMCSIAASIAAVTFTTEWRLHGHSNYAYFDARCFVLPEQEVINYLIWRQQDATRNAIQMVGQAHFSAKQLHGKNCNQIQEMLFQERGVNFNDLSTACKRGSTIIKICRVVDGVERTMWHQDTLIPIFTKDRLYIESRVAKLEEEKKNETADRTSAV